MATVKKNDRGKNPKGWIITYFDLSGTRRRKVVHCSKKIALMQAQEIEAKKTRIKMGFEKGYREKLMFSDAVRVFHSSRTKSENSIDRENWVYKAFKKFIGAKNIDQINQGLLVAYFDHRKEINKITDGGIGLEYRTLKALFNFLAEHDYIVNNPIKGLKSPRAGIKPVRFLTKEEIGRLVNVIDDPNDMDIIKMYLNTGARGREILKETFTWSSVDFKLKKFTLFGKGKKYRTIPMNETVYEILHRRKFIEKQEFPFDMNYDPIYRHIKKYYKAASIENANVYTLRKTFGSTLVQQGVNIYTVSKLMGHSSVTITERHYAELLDENLRDGIKTLDRI